jgi:hypothetical protein
MRLGVTVSPQGIPAKMALLAVQPALREISMGGRHMAPKPGTDVFMALIILALLVILAAIIIPAALGR